MTYNQFVEILKARWRSVAAWVFALMAIAIAINILLPKKYTATATVLINMNSADPVDGLGAIINPALGAGYMSTQIDILNSEQVARRVVRILRLDQAPALREQWQDDTDGRGNFEAWAAKTIQKRLDVRLSKDSNVVTVNYSSPDPKFSEAMANAFANVYIQTTIDLKTAPAKQYNAFFDARTKELKQQLEIAQTRLSDFERERGIVGSDERLDVETNRLNSLALNLTQAQGLTAESKSRQNAAKSSSDQLQDVLNNPVVSALKTDLSRQEARLNELSSKLGDAHPELAQIRANIAETKKKIEQETAQVSGGTRVTNVINNAREREIATTYEAQRQKLLRLKQDRDTAAILVKDVEAAQRAYDAVQARLSQVSLTSQATLNNISLLTPAVEPDSPSSPMPVLNIFASLLLGTLLGSGWAVLREQNDARLRTEQDITQSLSLVLLGSMPDGIAAKRSQHGWFSRKTLSGELVANRLITAENRKGEDPTLTSNK